jgi:hypothetical protein
MSKDGFNWKSLFINDQESDNTSPRPKEVKTNAPETTKFPSQPIKLDNASDQLSSTNPFLGEILEVYERGFESLNLADFDFFELYKSVVSAGANNPQSYQMAYTIGKSIKSDLSKDFLLEKSKFYIAEIEKVHAKYASAGNSKKSTLDGTVSDQKNKLNTRIADIEKQISELQRELVEKRTELVNADSTNTQQYSEIQQKIEANDYAKQRILDSINVVVSGINQYL